MSTRISISIDSILDTRLATLAYIDPQIADQAIEKGYRQRTSDRWQELGVEVSQEHYDRLYAQRQGEILELSRLTNIVPVFSRILNDMARQAIYTPFSQDDYLIEINTYPFSMSERVARHFCAAFGYMLPADYEITWNYLDHDSLTPELIHQHYAAIFLYDFDGWLSAQQERLKERILPTVSFITPALYANGRPDSKDCQIEGYGEVDPFASTEMLLCEYLTLHFVDARYFSLVELD